MIFLSIVGGWTGAVLYDKREKKKIQKKWCDLVAHIAQQPLPPNQMPRKITVFISAPPGDGIRPSRTYFKEYVKPVLVAAAMDYDVIEGRKEGDVRYGTAEQIRRRRRKLGEKGTAPVEEEMDTEAAIDMIRDKMFVSQETGVRGDLVLGRHTWKEYIRGLHEGWLGPIDEPPPPPEPITLAPVEPLPGQSQEESSPNTDKALKEEEKKEETKKPYPPPAYLMTEKYASATLSPHTPRLFEPSQPIHQQHLLGFLKTPQRVYNFLTRRYLADHIGRQTAAIVLAASRPYEQGSSFSAFTDSPSDVDPLATRAPESDASPTAPATSNANQKAWEQQSALIDDEARWHKSVRKPRKEDDTSEPIWIRDVVVDERVGSRMRKFELEPEEEARANRLASGSEKPNVPEPLDLRKEKVVIGNLDDD
jgi:mitochondrial import inner membrane translocase subunit TIM54